MPASWAPCTSIVASGPCWARRRATPASPASLLTARQVRPTALAPVWRLAGFALGAGTALMGEKAAHACTEAVETVIEQHYAGQIAELESREPELAAELSRFRAEELAHRDQAVAEGAREAPGYALLSAVIRTGCRAAIKISEKL
jgi:ubiquinone biosynthesis monooxygenase Coq7